MGFFYVQNTKMDKQLRGLNPDFLRKHSCNVCPLNALQGLHSPKMLPTGSKAPTALMLSDSPSAGEDAAHKLFVGKTGKLLRDQIPKEWNDKLRWSTTVNCKTKDDNFD